MVQTSAILVAQNFLAAFLQTGCRYRVAFRSLLDGFDGKRHIGRQNQHIVTSHERNIRHTVLPHLFRDAFHVEAIGENQAFKAHLAFQQVGYNAMRKRGGSVLNFLNGREIKVTYHGTVHPLFNHITERSKLNVAHLVHRAGHCGKGHVGIGGRVAVAREVFHTGNQSFALHTQCVCCGLFAHFCRIFTKATHSYNGIGSVGVDIRHGSEVHMDAHALALFRHLLPHLVNQFIIADSPQGHLIRICQRLLHTHCQAPFSIDGHHQWGLCHGLPCIGLVDLSLGIGTEETHATDVILLDVLGHILIKRLVGLVGAHTY